MRYQETGGTPHRTLQENTAKEGTKVFNFIHEKSKRILKANGFTEEGAYLGNNPEYSKSEPVTLSDETIKKASEECIEEQEIRIDALENPVCYEHPENTLNICIDDVNVKRQESTRQQREDVEKRKHKKKITERKKNQKKEKEELKKKQAYQCSSILSEILD
jgi:hypothetical protein